MYRLNNPKFDNQNCFLLSYYCEIKDKYGMSVFFP